MKWSNEEVEMLKEISDKGKDVIMKHFHYRTWKSVRHKIINSGFPIINAYERYTDEEDNILKSNSLLAKEELLLLLPDRKWDSIAYRIEVLGLERDKRWNLWSEEEESIVLECETLEEMILRLPKRTESMVYEKAIKLGKRFDNFWTDEELDILKNNYQYRQVKEYIHLLPERNEQAVYNKANKLGLKGVMGKKMVVKDEEFKKLADEGMFKSQIARELEVTPTTVTYRLEKMGIFIEDMSPIGESHSSWKGGLTSENARIRGQKEYREWRLLTFERDFYKCMCCGDGRGGNLQAHHIYNFSNNKEIRFDTTNSITMCNLCHDPKNLGSFHHTYGTRENDIYQLQEYFDDIRSHLGLPLVSIEKIVNQSE